MSHLVLRRINGKWRMFNKHTKKVEGKPYEHKEEAAIATHKKDIGEDKVFDRAVEEEHEEHPEFSKKSAKKIAIDHERIKAEGKKPADEKGKGAGKYKMPEYAPWKKSFGKMKHAAKKVVKHKEPEEYGDRDTPEHEVIEDLRQRSGRGGGILNPYDKDFVMGRGGAKPTDWHKVGKSSHGEQAYEDRSTGKKEIYKKSKNGKYRVYDRDISEGRGSDMQNMTYNKITSGKGADKPAKRYYKVTGKQGADRYKLGYTSSKSAWLRDNNGWKKEDLEFERQGKGGAMDKLHPIVDEGRMRKHDRYATSGMGGSSTSGNHTTGAQRYNDRMNKIFEQAGLGYSNIHKPGHLYGPQEKPEKKPKKKETIAEQNKRHWLDLQKHENTLPGEGRGMGAIMNPYDKDYVLGRGGDRPPMHLNLKKGALHKELGVSQDKNIPAKKLAIHSGDSELERKRKQFAINAKKWNK